MVRFMRLLRNIKGLQTEIKRLNEIIEYLTFENDTYEKELHELQNKYYKKAPQ